MQKKLNQVTLLYDMHKSSQFPVKQEDSVNSSFFVSNTLYTLIEVSGLNSCHVAIYLCQSNFFINLTKFSSLLHLFFLNHKQLEELKLILSEIFQFNICFRSQNSKQIHLNSGTFISTSEAAVHNQNDFPAKSMVFLYNLTLS